MDSFSVRGIGGEAIDGIGRVGDQTTVAEDIGGLLDELLAGILTLVRHDC